MSEVTTKIKKNKQLNKLIAQYNIKSAGTGTPFWLTRKSEAIDAQARILVSNKNPQEPIVYLRVEAEDTSFNVNLGLHYDAMQSMTEYENEVIDVKIAPRVPNPALTDADIEAVEANPNRGTAATARIKAARASEDATGELVLISYEEPEE